MENNIRSLDDLIFRSRNKAYGAYENRRNYSKYLLLALIGGILFFSVLVSAPLLANYFGEKTLSEDHDITTVIMDPPDTKPIDIEIPEEAKPKLEDRAIFEIKVVSDLEDEDDLSMMLDTVGNRLITDTTGSVSSDPPIDPRIIDVEPPVVTHMIVEEMPEFPGGDAGRLKYLSANTKYPESAKEIGLQGTVYVGFVVNEKGKVVEVELLRGIGGGCDEEALRVVKNMPDWKPGRQSGNEVRVRFSMPICFRLQNM